MSAPLDILSESIASSSSLVSQLIRKDDGLMADGPEARIIVDGGISAGADPKLGDSLGFTPLHQACYLGNSESVRLLLAAENQEAVLQALAEAGVQPLSQADYETKRIEAGGN